MTSQKNEFGQPIGSALPDWQGALVPPKTKMMGHHCRVDPLIPALHGTGLFQAFSADTEGKLWTYMASGPFQSEDQFMAWIETASTDKDSLFHAIIDNTTEKVLGLCAFLRIKPAAGVIEVGNITFAPALQQTIMATEAMFLMMTRVFDELGYRRYEWKCDALNLASRKAATRLGFTYEGTFAQALVYKNRNRDTAWFAILDSQWPRLKGAYLQWLSPSNFDVDGIQKQTLSSLLSASDQQN